MRRKLIGWLSVCLAILVLILGVPSAATAADPLPGPVDDLMQLPSTTSKALTGSPMANQAYTGIARALTEALKGGAVVPAPPTPPAPVAPANLPKPIAPAALLRGNTALVAFTAAWALTAQGELVLVSAATGESYENVFCTRPDWYQNVTGFVSLGFRPDCVGEVIDANSDAGGEPTLTTAAGTITLQGTTVPTGWTYKLGCYGGSVAKPTGTSWQRQRDAGWVSFSGPASNGYDYQNGCYPAGFRGGISASLGPIAEGGTGLLRLVNTTTGAVVATMTAPSSDPLRTPRCKVSGGGDTFIGTGTPYRESEGIPMSSAGLGCKKAMEDFVSSPGRGPGFIPEKIEVESQRDDGGAITEIADTDVPSFTESEKKGLQAGNGRGLVLEKVVGTTVSSCMTWAADCSGWWSATSNGTQPTTGTTTYRCTYAGQPVDLAECGPYRNTFDTQTQTPTITDPATGQPVPWTSQPSTGNSINPGTGPGTGASPADTCFANGWADVANPIDWVLVPVKCALVWAFVPRTGVVQGTVSSLGAAAGDVATVDPLIAMLNGLPAGGGCGGIPVSLTFFGQTATGTLLDACGPPGSTVATFVNGAIVLLVATAALIAVTRYAAAVFGFVGPGGSFQQQEYSNAMMARSAARSD